MTDAQKTLKLSYEKTLDAHRDYLKKMETKGVGNTERDDLLLQTIFRYAILMSEIRLEENEPPAFDELTEDEQQAFIDLAISAVSDTLICTRTWSAWGHNTMGPNDFVDSTDCDERIVEIAEEIYKFTLDSAKKKK